MFLPALMSAYPWEGRGVADGDVVVGVTEPDGGHPHQQLPPSRSVEVHLGHLVLAGLSVQDCATGLHGCSSALRGPRC
jgi:hypothetical protein